MIYEWNSAKAEQNLKKHGVSFDEASSVFRDPFALTIADTDRSLDEPRFITIRVTNKQRFVVVVHTDRADAVRLISARAATRKEKYEYEEAKR